MIEGRINFRDFKISKEGSEIRKIGFIFEEVNLYCGDNIKLPDIADRLSIYQKWFGVGFIADHGLSQDDRVKEFANSVEELQENSISLERALCYTFQISCLKTLC